MSASHKKKISDNVNIDKIRKEKELSTVSKFHLKLFEQALKTNEDINHEILQNQSDAVAVKAQASEKIQCDIQNVIPPPHEASDSLKLEQNEAKQRRKQFYEQLKEKENVIKMQEERRQIADGEIAIQEVETENKKKMAENLLQHALVIQNDALRTRSTVEAYRAYKDYVEKSVPHWEREANNVETVCGRFRDLLTLRFQLMIEVQDAFKKLQKTRERYENLIKNEKIAEGKALLEVYHYRSTSWQSNRDVEAADDQLRRLRNSSAEIATRLTRMKLALANMYSVARKFQASLPPLEPNTPSTDLIVHLHNFILDASKVVKIAKMEENADSQRQIKGSSN